MPAPPELRPDAGAGAGGEEVTDVDFEEVSEDK